VGPLIAFWLALAPAPQEPKEAIHRIEVGLEEQRERCSIPGMSAALVQHRKVVWSHGYGLADLEHEVWATPETRYRLASVSKPFAAVLVMQLVEQGQLSLDAPMKDFAIPKWFAPDPGRYAAQPILLKHVLSHTSEGVPGEAYSYNGNIYSDLTWVLEQVTRTAYPRLLQERIFDAVGMERSVPGHVRPGTTELAELARPYRWEGGEHVPATWQMMDLDPALDLTDFNPVLLMPEEMVAARKALLGDGYLHLNAVCAAGEATSTVLDLAKFDVALDEGRLLSAASRARMFTPARTSAGQTLPYALGWFVEEIGGRTVIWHYGWLPPAVSALYVKVPSEELSFFVLANNDRLSAGVAWTAQGLRASPFARLFLEAFGLAGG